MTDDLEIARELIRAGVPLFVARAHLPGGACTYEHCREGLDSKVEFHHPGGWQHVRPTLGMERTWQPGDALCAVMGHGVDVVDVDPRNGGTATYEALKAAGLMPRAYAVAETPSGGRHYFVAGLHAAKGKAGAGVDVQAGADDGSGRGFVYIAPTVRTAWPHTDPATATAYRWDTRPDFGDMDGDDSGEALGAQLRAARATVAPGEIAPAIVEADDPFEMPDNSLTADQAKAIYLPVYESFRGMRTPQDSGFNDALNKTACVIGHFVPAFMSREQAEAALYAAAVHNLSVDFQGERSVRATIASGLAKGMSEPRTRRAVTHDDAKDLDDASDDASDAATLLIGEMLSAEQLRSAPNPVPLIGGLLDLDTTSWLIGKAGSFKTFVALDWAGHTGQGKPWQGREVAQGNVVYIVAEGVRGMKLRVAAWERTYGPMVNVWFLPRPVQASNATAWDTLVEACRRLDARMVVIDTQARVTVGMEENAAKDMGVYVDAADRIKRATGACVLTVHHIGRQGTDARGSSALDGAQDAEIRVDRAPKEEGRRVKLIMDKQKDQDDSEEIELELAVSEGEADPVTGRPLSSLVVVRPGTIPRAAPVRDWIDNLTENQAVVVGCFADFAPHVGETKAAIRKMCTERSGMAYTSFIRAWDAMVDQERIIRVKSTQRYILTDASGA